MFQQDKMLPFEFRIGATTARLSDPRLRGRCEVLRVTLDEANARIQAAGYDLDRFAISH